MDFALILVVATGATGLISLIDLVLLRRRRLLNAAGGQAAREPIIVEYSRSFFPVLLLVLLLRSFLFEPFRIPSASMMPTLLEGDFIFVNKYTYGLRLPVLNSKILEVGEPERGDVVVFRLPSEPTVNYIKRVVGLPGDVVDYDPREKRISINGERVEIALVGEHFDRIQYDVGLEVLGEHEHEVMLARHSQSLGGRYVVPDGSYFVMGDNRDNSKDSRYEGVEFIPEDHLVGRAVRIWMSWRAPSEGGPRWSRIGQGIN